MTKVKVIANEVKQSFIQIRFSFLVNGPDAVVCPTG
jgi:hypothetical protein